MGEDDKVIKTLFGRMAALCSRREYCSGDILEKLRKAGAGSEDSEKVLEMLKKDGYLSDVRYAYAFVRDKSQISGWGPKKIAYALRNKGLDQDLVNSAIDEVSVDPETRRRMESVISMKWKSLSKEDRKIRETKTLRYALGRGYGYSESLQIIRKLSGLQSL